MYDSKLTVFKKWLELQPIQVCSMTTVADFLLHKFKGGSAPSTIEGYRTAIADAFPLLVSHEILH